MSELVITTSDTAAGFLKGSKIGDLICRLTHRLAEGPVPARGNPEQFFDDRRELYLSEGLPFEEASFSGEPLETRSEIRMIWSGLPDVMRSFNRVTLWIDPDPNAQLVLIQLLDWIGRTPELRAKCWLKQSETMIGERQAGDWSLPAQPISGGAFDLASRAWAAYRSSTPEAWASLLQSDVEILPGLKNAIIGLLKELPDNSGLGATHRRVINLAERLESWDRSIAQGAKTNRQLHQDERLVRSLLQRVSNGTTQFCSGYWEVGQALCELATSRLPAVMGIVEPKFSLEMHDDKERWSLFMNSTIQLTDFGQRLRRGEDDWMRHNLISRWWGGTRLSNEVVWRWDNFANKLSGPEKVARAT